MGKALLINPSYFRTYGSNEGGLAFPVYPVLSLATLAGQALERGHDVEILDLSYRRYDPSLIRSVIEEQRPDVVGITATTPLANQMRDISYIVKDVSDSIVTIGGGAHPTALPGATLRQSALDHVAAGEADSCIADLLDGRSPSAIAGLHWLDGDEVAFTAGRLEENLDNLAMPAWQRYPMEGNQRITRLAARYRPVATIEFSRGCVYQCDFCGSKNTMGRGYRKKSPERCAEELVRLASMGFREAVLVDDIFTSDTEWATEVCEAIIRRAPGVAWSCTNGIRVDSADDELFRLMRRAGCYRVYFGLESGSDAVLKAFGKGGRASIEQARRAIRSARDAGLEPNGFFLVGLTGDTVESMQDTIDFASAVDLDSMKCGICVPFPGTPMFDELYARDRIKTLDWDAYTVYNEADSIFDHPVLEWSTIREYFNRFYRQAYFRNPGFLLRRLRYVLRTHELFWNVFYTVKFALMLWKPGSEPTDDEYAYDHVWRSSDLVVGEPLERVVAPRSSRGGGATRRDGLVSVVLRTDRSGERARTD